MRNAVSRGCPQEGVLLFLWCLVVDVLIARLARGGIYIQGYADDIHLLVVGRFLNISLWLVQWALHTVGTRCSLVRFSVYHDKTELILTRRRKLSGFFEPYFFGVSQASGGSSAFSADLEGACGCKGEEGSQSVVGLLEGLWYDVGPETQGGPLAPQ